MPKVFKLPSAKHYRIASRHNYRGFFFRLATSSSA